MGTRSKQCRSGATGPDILLLHSPTRGGHRHRKRIHRRRPSRAQHSTPTRAIGRPARSAKGTRMVTSNHRPITPQRASRASFWMQMQNSSSQAAPHGVPASAASVDDTETRSSAAARGKRGQDRGKRAAAPHTRPHRHAVQQTFIEGYNGDNTSLPRCRTAQPRTQAGCKMCKAPAWPQQAAPLTAPISHPPRQGACSAKPLYAVVRAALRGEGVPEGAGVVRGSLQKAPRPTACKGTGYVCTSLHPWSCSPWPQSKCCASLPHACMRAPPRPDAGAVHEWRAAQAQCWEK